MIRRMLVRMLVKLGSQVDEASDGQEAIDIVQKALSSQDEAIAVDEEWEAEGGDREPAARERMEKEREKGATRSYDVILMDSVMPRVSGLEATEAIVRRLGFRGLVVGVTGNILPEDTEGILFAHYSYMVAVWWTPYERQSLYLGDGSIARLLVIF
jgi:CheY-like chemotaxis protein